MIVSELELGPFAGISQRIKIKFDSGLNIVLGPNETGKSTLVKALLSALFLQINPGKNTREYKEELKPLFPHPYGDTINVRVCITCNGEVYQLKKTWGEKPSVELTLPNGNAVNNERKVLEKLDEILAYGSGTYRNILIAEQADMARTIKDLRGNSEATNTLGEALRRTMFEADGVSVDAIKERINEERKALLKNWDLNSNSPEKDRGYDNQWQSKGKVLEAYYDLEGQGRRLKEAKEAEENYSKMSNKLKEIQEEIEKLSVEVNELESISEDVRKRKELELELLILKGKDKDLKEANDKWPVVEKDKEIREKEIKETKERKEKLEAELEAANAGLKSQSTRDLYNKVEPVHKNVHDLQRQINKLANIVRDDLTDLRKVESEIDAYKAAISAGKLSAKFISQPPMELTVQKDFEQSQLINIEPGSEAILEAATKLIIESQEQGWQMELWSGDRDIEEIKKERDESLKKLDEKMAKLNVRSVEEVEQIVEQREKIERSLEVEKGRLKTLLGSKSYESLKEAFDNLGEKNETREPDRIRKEINEVSSKQSRYELELQNIQEKLETWKKKYGNRDKVIDELVDLRSQGKEIERKLEQLAPLPDLYDSADTFQKDLEEKERRLQSLKNEGNELRVDLARAEANLSDESTEDIEKALKLYEKEFQDFKNRAKALTRVEAVFNKVVDEMDANPYWPLLESFAGYLAPLTGNRYKSGSMKGPLPSGIIREDGREVPIGLLSTGTGDGTAIALRLAMAEHLLQGRKGFMIMDDPLVNLDPERRKAAAGVLRDFASKFQLIITTCDPTTADLLGGNLIRI